MNTHITNIKGDWQEVVDTCRATSSKELERIGLRLGEPELLAQMAEEAAELAQAALKLRRAITNINTTIKGEDECRQSLIEEYTDVIHCALVLGMDADLEQIQQKTERWKKRLQIGGENDNEHHTSEISHR